jgi:alpha-D-xyloside xylohydrolase
LLFCNSYLGHMDVAAADPGLVQFRAAGGEVDYFVFAGRSGKDLIGAYTALTGRSPMPPRWAFGYWQSRAGWGAQDWALELAGRLRRDGFPLDVIHMDGWSEGDLRFAPQRFSDPEGFVKRLAAMGVKVCIWETPFVHPAWRMFRQGLDRGYFALKPDGGYYPISTWVGEGLGLLDFLNPETCRWWQDAHKPVLGMGIGAVKTDGGDTAEVPADAVFHGGYVGQEVHNLYPLLFNRCVYEGQQRLRPGLRVINWTRTGYAGIQRYPCTWGGDEPSNFDGGRTLVRAGINAGLCGIAFWSHDLGGFADGRTREYYVRSCQWGFLSPLSRIHGIAEMSAEPGITGNEPWVYGPETEAIVREYVKLRYRLLPYLYSCAHEAAATGVPIMRALPLEFPDDARAYAEDYEYMLGPALLVAPIVEPSGRADLRASRKVYLPEGQWYDYWTDKRLRGPATVTVVAPLDTLPVFVRAGAVIPYGPDIAYIAGPPAAALTVDAYAGADGAFGLVEDDGVTLRYREGQVARTALGLREARAGARRTVTVSLAAPAGRYDGMPPARPVTVRVHGLEGTVSAAVNGKPAACRRDEAGRVVVGPLGVQGPAKVAVTAEG